MSELARRILEEAEMLSDDERAQVALKLLRPMSGELSDAWREELQERVAALEAGTMKTRAWHDVRADVLKMLAK